MKKEEKEKVEVYSPLRKEKITVRFVARKRGSVDDPRHVQFGGMHQDAFHYYTVPLLRNGGLVNVLTDDEKAFFESYLGLEEGALSVHNTKDNYWDDSNPNGFGRIKLPKEDTTLDLSNAYDYIKYKILRANKDKIAPSLKVLQDTPKATYEYVLIADNDVHKSNAAKVSAKAQAWKDFGKIDTDYEKLKMIIETIDGKPIARGTDIEVLQSKIGDIIDSNAKLFSAVANDKLLDIKILIKKCVEAGLIAYRGNQYYLRQDNSPLCDLNQEPTLNVAATYLSSPKNQDLLFSLEAKLKEKENDNN